MLDSELAQRVFTPSVIQKGGRVKQAAKYRI